MTARPGPSPLVRALALAAVALVALQLLFLDEPQYARDLVAMTWDKLVHFTVYGGLAFLLWVGFGQRSAALVWLSVVLLGAADETHQLFTPGRDADIRDLAADGLGAACALLFFTFLTAPSPAAKARARYQPGD